MAFIPSHAGYMISSNDNSEFVFSLEAASQNTYSPEICNGFQNMQSYPESPEYSHPRTTLDSRGPLCSFDGGPVYPNVPAPFYDGIQSPHLCVPSELREPSPDTSVMPGPLTSSAKSSLDLNRQAPSKWAPSLGINTNAAGDCDSSFILRANCKTSSTEENLFAYMGEPHIFVGDYLNLSDSTFIPPNRMELIETHRDGSNANTQRPIQSSIPTITPPSSFSDVFESPTRISSSRNFSVSSLATSASAGPVPDIQSSPIFPNAPSFDPAIVGPASYPPYNSFLYHTSGQPVAPLEPSRSVPISIVYPSRKHRRQGNCPKRGCGKFFKDLSAHIVTHQNVRPERCPVIGCDYNTKGFSRKYDKNRHILTHYKGIMVCGFCPGSGSLLERSFNRADVFKRHLLSVHAVEKTSSHSRKKTSRGINDIAANGPDANGKCSTCSAMFQNAQEFYEHLDDCVLQIVQQEGPRRLPEVEDDSTINNMSQSNDQTAISGFAMGGGGYGGLEFWN